MKSARAASAAVPEEFAELDGGWMSPTAATCMTPPPGGSTMTARGFVAARERVGVVRDRVVAGGTVVVAGGAVDDDVVVSMLGPGPAPSRGAAADSRVVSRPAGSWLLSGSAAPTKTNNVRINPHAIVRELVISRSWPTARTAGASCVRGETDDEPSAARAGFDEDATAVRLDDLLGDGQTETRAPGGAAARVVQPGE